MKKLSLDEIAECVSALSFDELKELEQVIIKAYNILSKKAGNYL